MRRSNSRATNNLYRLAPRTDRSLTWVARAPVDKSTTTTLNVTDCCATKRSTTPCNCAARATGSTTVVVVVDVLVVAALADDCPADATPRGAGSLSLHAAT